MSQRLGKAYIKVNGKILESMPGAKLDLGGVERTPVTGANSVHGFAEKIRPSMIECEISVGKDTDLLQHAKWAAETATFECDTGQTFVIKNAFSAEPPVLTAEDGGKVPVKFYGDPADLVN